MLFYLSSIGKVTNSISRLCLSTQVTRGKDFPTKTPVEIKDNYIWVARFGNIKGTNHIILL